MFGRKCTLRKSDSDADRSTARSAAKVGARVGAAAGSRAGPFGAGLGSGLGGATGYIAGAVIDVDVRPDPVRVTVRRGVGPVDDEGPAGFYRASEEFGPAVSNTPGTTGGADDDHGCWILAEIAERERSDLHVVFVGTGNTGRAFADPPREGVRGGGFFLRDVATLLGVQLE